MKLNQKGRISVLELVIILVICVEGIYLLGNGLGWYASHISSGNDGLYVNTAESVAKVNSLNGMQCPVQDCGNASETCTHYTGQGYVGYFDSESNTIVGYKVKGYNSEKNPKVNGRSYTGEVNSMILRITANEGSIVLDWVGGKK